MILNFITIFPNSMFITIIMFLIFIIFLFMRSTDHYRTELRSYQCGCTRMSSFIMEIGMTKEYKKHTDENMDKYTKMMEGWNE